MQEPYEPTHDEIARMTEAFRRERPRLLVEEQREECGYEPRVYPESVFPVLEMFHEPTPSEIGIVAAIRD